MSHFESLSKGFFRKRLLAILFMVMGCLAFSGCAFWNTSKVAFHAIDYPSPKAVGEAINSETIMVYRFLTDSSIDIRFLQISQPDSSKRTITGHAWLYDPSQTLTELVIRDLQASGLFKKAVDQTSNLPYRYGLEGAIRKFEGLVGDNEGWGLIEAEIKLIDFEPEIIGKGELFKKVYTLKIPSKNTQPESIVEALNEAVQQLSDRIREDVSRSIIR